MTEILKRPTQARFRNDPNLSDLLDTFRREVLLSFNCHSVGTIQDFDSTTQLAKITINYQKTFLTRNSLNGTYEEIQQNYPILVDCPIVVMRGSSGYLTFPIAKGDNCIVMFNDRALDNWYATGQTGPVASPRLHSFSDAMAIVGVSHAKNAIEDYDKERVSLRNGTAKICVSETKIELSNEATDLKTAVDGLIDIVSSFDSAVTTFMAAMAALAGGAAPATQAMLQAPGAAAVTALGVVSSQLVAQKVVFDSLLEKLP